MRFQQLLDPRFLKTAYRPLSGLLFAFLVAFLVSGCGGSSGRDSYVANPGGGSGDPALANGRVTYNFVKAQADPIVVPQTTQSIRFQFYTGFNGTGNLVKQEVEPFAAQITIENVPTNVRSSVVTAIDEDGFPIFAFTSDFQVFEGQTTTVGLADGTGELVNLVGLRTSPLSLSLGLNGAVVLEVLAEFSNGDLVPLSGNTLAEASFSTSDDSVATVSNEGLVSAALPGSAFILAEFRGFDIAVPVVVSVGGGPGPVVESLTVTPTEVTLPVGTASEPLAFTVEFENGITQPVTMSQGITFSSTIAGVTVNENAQIVVGNETLSPATGTVTFTFSGRQAQVQVQVLDAVLQEISVTPPSASLPFGGFEQDLAVMGTFSNGLQVEIANENLTFTESSPNFTVSPGGLITTSSSGTAGTANVTVEANVGDVTLSQQVPVTVGTVVVESLAATPAGPPATNMSPGEFIEFTVQATLSDNQVFDVTNFQALQLSTTGTAVVVNQNRAVAVQVGTSNLTFSMPGTGAGGSNVTTQVTINVTEVLLESVVYIYAGNPFQDNQLNLPRGYVGVFEILGTFTNGSQRLLRPDEYEVVKLNTGAIRPDALQLFNNDYELPTLAGRYTDLLPRDPATQDTALQVADDMLGFRRVIDPGELNSNAARVVTRDTFRAVVADWRRGGVDPIAGVADLDFEDPNITGDEGDSSLTNASFRSPNSTDNFELLISPALTATPGQFDRTNISITVTDPSTVSITSVAFKNYPEENNVAVGNPREIEVRANFAAVNSIGQGSVSDADPGSMEPLVAAQNNFRLAEANIRFDITSTLPDNERIIHIPTLVGYPTLARLAPVDVATVTVTPSPVGGIAARPFVATEPQHTLGPAPNDVITAPLTYTPGTYEMINSLFGPTGSVTFQEPSLVRNPIFDPGPPVAGASLNPVNRNAFQPPDNMTIGSVLAPQNGSFAFTIPTLFTLDPIDEGGPVQIQVGASQEFRTLVQFQEDGPVVDRSLDYLPRLVGTPTSVIGQAVLATGRLFVSGINSNEPNATVRATDATGNEIVPQGTFTDSLGNTGAARAQVEIEVTPAP